VLDSRVSTRFWEKRTGVSLGVYQWMDLWKGEVVKYLCQTWEGAGGVLDVELPILRGGGIVNDWLKCSSPLLLGA
jgi:hypothetical protein